MPFDAHSIRSDVDKRVVYIMLWSCVLFHFQQFFLL